MKKLTNIILVFTMFLSCLVPCTTNKVEASSSDLLVIENVDWSEAGFIDVKVTYRSNVEEKKSIFYESKVPSLEIDYIIEETGDYIHFERIGDIGYHYVNNELKTTILYDLETTSTRSATVPSSIATLEFYPTKANLNPRADGFSYFYYVKQTSWRISAFEDYITEQVQSFVISLLMNAMFGGLNSLNTLTIVLSELYSTASDMYSYIMNIVDIASILTNGDLNGVDLLYQSFNNQCGILAWYGFDSYPVVNNRVDATYGGEFIMNQNHSWDGHPYDYSQPAACRALVNIYP